MMKHTHVAIDLGASSGRHVLGWLEKLCLRKPGSVLLPYAFFSGNALPQEQRLLAELADWLDLADEDVVPHCYVSSPVADLDAQVQTVACALACGQQFFYMGGEYYDHLYDPIRPRGTAPGDRFASVGYAVGPVQETAWLAGVQTLVSVVGEGKGPRSALLVALPRTVDDPHRIEAAWEDALEGSLPVHLNETAFCCMAPGEEAQVLLLQSGLAAGRIGVLQSLAEMPPAEDYFAARDDRN